MRNRYKKGSVVCLLALGVACTTYGQTRQYSVEQCRTLALENNARIKNANYELQSAREEEKQAFTNYFPSVSATGFGFNADKGTAQMNLAPGMEMSMLKNGLAGGIVATQPVFAGGQIVNGNKIAKLAVEMKQLQVQQSEKEVMLTAEQYAWQVLTLQEKLQTVLSVDTMLQRICNEVEVSVNAGVALRNDLLEVNLRRNEIASERINLENGIALSKMLLAQYIGLEDTDFEITSRLMNQTAESLHMDSIFCDPASSLPLTPEYQLLEKNLKLYKLQHKISIGKNLPTVGVGAGYMYHDFLDVDRSFGVIFASISIPLSGWWGGSHAMKKQKLQVKMAENELMDKSQLLKIQMQKCWNDLEDAHKQLEIASLSVEQASENFRLNRQYYQAGTITMTDLLNAQTLYQQNCDKYVDAIADCQIKRLKYLQATGR